MKTSQLKVMLAAVILAPSAAFAACVPGKLCVEAEAPAAETKPIGYIEICLDPTRTAVDLALGAVCEVTQHFEFQKPTGRVIGGGACVTFDGRPCDPTP